jgi:hypothetical protein
MRAASALTTGGSGGCLWLTARIAQHRCKKRGGGITTVRGSLHLSPQSTPDAQQVPVATLRMILTNQRPGQQIKERYRGCEA